MSLLAGPEWRTLGGKPSSVVVHFKHIFSHWGTDSRVSSSTATMGTLLSLQGETWRSFQASWRAAKLLHWQSRPACFKRTSFFEEEFRVFYNLDTRGCWDTWSVTGEIFEQIIRNGRSEAKQMRNTQVHIVYAAILKFVFLWKWQ